MRTLIIGGGAIGSTVAAYLTRAGAAVTMADGWFHHVEAIRRDGLRVEAVEGDLVVAVDAIHLDDLARAGPADLVLIAGKSYDTRLFALLAREHLHDGTIVMSAQNGMNDAQVADIIGADRTEGCVVAMAADLLDAGHVRRTSPESVSALTIGHLRPGDIRDLNLCAELLGALGNVTVVDDLWPERWGKLCLNTMSNAMAGLTGLRSDQLWSDDAILDVVTALAHETATVAAASGVSAAPVLGRIPHRTLLAAARRGNEAWREVLSAMQSVSAERVGKRGNRASLLQDIEKGRRTEIHHLNGWVAKRGHALGVPTPTHARIVSDVETVEAYRRPPAVENAKSLIELVRRTYA